MDSCLIDGGMEELEQLMTSSSWIEEDVFDPEDKKPVFQRLAESVLHVIFKSMPNASSGYLSLTGLKAGYFRPVAVFKRDVERHPIFDVKCGSDHPEYLIPKAIASPQLISVFQDIENFAHYHGVPETKEKMVIKLINAGEFFGYINLDSNVRGCFRDMDMNKVSAMGRLVGKMLGDALFYSRIRKLAAPLFAAFRESNSIGLIYREIVDDACFGFGADAVVLRLLDEKSGELPIAEFGGTIHPNQLDCDSAAEQLCKIILESVAHPWTMQSIDFDGSVKIGGCIIPEDIRHALELMGIQSFIIARLDGPDSSGHLGTLAVIHNRPHVYSTRDVALFYSYCKRVSDGLLIARQHESLKLLNREIEAQNEKLSNANDLIEDMSYNISRAEVLSLLGHDLVNRVAGLEGGIKDLEETCKKAIREERNWSFIEDSAKRLHEQMYRLKQNISRLSTVAKGTMEDSQEFNLYKLLQETASAVQGSLNKLSLTIDLNGVPRDTKIFSKPSILSQIVFNLITNSRDAQKSRTKLKPNEITITYHEERAGGRTYSIIDYRDEGPGINRQIFQEAESIFELGKTSKSDKAGAGLGLPISRNIAERHLKGDLKLVDADRAMFRLRIPKALEKEAV